ncbi:hypothetical protein FOZ63_006106 [Perkinsus olseni]|uniref:Uncharacterized protein n=1 Tax=Perkinsus olseni TaxID=32597 RepID=A0A7J6SGK9_PEROL|nr:hypothetical protein FOZ63_006106 [Perkinsus olseni]
MQLTSTIVATVGFLLPWLSAADLVPGTYYKCEGLPNLSNVGVIDVTESEIFFYFEALPCYGANAALYGPYSYEVFFGSLVATQFPTGDIIFSRASLGGLTSNSLTSIAVDSQGRLMMRHLKKHPGSIQFYCRR